MENNNTGFRAKIQKFGGVLSGMVMPNIGAFITWGLITAIFLQTGWHPNAHIAKLISPMLSYLLPILIGNVDVSKIAVYFGGGGHMRAAGCDLQGSVYDVINNVTEQICKQFQEQEV